MEHEGAGLKQKRSRQFPVRGLYMYIIYTPGLGFAIAVCVREREQGHV